MVLGGAGRAAVGEPGLYLSIMRGTGKAEHGALVVIPQETPLGSSAVTLHSETSSPVQVCPCSFGPAGSD